MYTCWIRYEMLSLITFHLCEGHDEWKIFLAGTLQSLACFIGKLLGIRRRNNRRFRIGDVAFGEQNITLGKFSCDLKFTYQILVVKQGTLCLEQKGKDFVFFLLQLIFSLQCLASITVECFHSISHLVSQEAALLLQLLFVNVDQALQHVGLKKLGAHLEVDNLKELLRSKD